MAVRKKRAERERRRTRGSVEGRKGGKAIVM
jgi:hypothetical protein